MPRRRAGEVERWEGTVEELVDVVVDEIMDHGHGRAMTDVTDGEIRARGIFAFHALRERQSDTRTRAPPQWSWGRKRWIIPVRQKLARRLKEREEGREAAAVLAGIPRGGTLEQRPPRVSTVPPRRRFHDDGSPNHPGWELFKGVFSKEDVARLLELKERVRARDWAHLFNSVEWEPDARDKKRICAALNSSKNIKEYEGVVMPRKRQGWSATVVSSAFRQQAHVGTRHDEEWLIERMRHVLPEDAVFPPPGHVGYMIQNVRSAPKTASRSEQPMHYDFEPGLRRLGVVISLHDSVYLAVGDRWSDDVTRVSARVRIPKGSVLIFSNSVPHAGMGDVGEDGVERLHIYVGLGCSPEEVHPVSEEDGELLTYLASQESASRMSTVSRRRVR